jgi:hypothetical protein
MQINNNSGTANANTAMVPNSGGSGAKQPLKTKTKAHIITVSGELMYATNIYCSVL